MLDVHAFLYVGTPMKLRLCQQDLDLCDDGSLLTFNDSITRPCGAADLPLSLGEGEDEIWIILFFFIVSCKSAFSGIIGTYFLATLDVMASPVHLKVIYLSDAESLIVLDVDLRTTRSICDAIIRKLFTTIMVSEEAQG